MDRITRWLPIFLLLSSISYNCGDNKTKERIKTDKSISSDTNQVVLEFNFDINREVYQKTNFGDPPQLAIWIENLDSGIVKTVWVSRRTAKQEWKGKIECLVSLPYWEYRTAMKNDESPTRDIRDPDIDAVSGATPFEGRFSASILVPKESQFIFYIEVNVSADYNNTFTYWSKDGLPDSEANGQPSIVYRGQIVADGKSHSIPILLGRTEQRRVAIGLTEDLEGITTAKHLLGNIQVRSMRINKSESSINP
jgi:hypothetical protein